jgi:hypothetical protein
MKLFLSVLFALLISLPAWSTEYSDIDVQSVNQAITTFVSGTDDQKEQLRTEIENEPNRYAPILFFHFASYLLEQGEEDEALFWFSAGKLRMYYDIRRCTDRSVGGAMQIVKEKMPPLLLLLQFEDVDNTREVLDRVLEWDRSTGHDYDCRWIALHGIKAFLPKPADGSVESLTIPQEEWETVAEEIRLEFSKGFDDFVSSVSEADMETITNKIEELRAASAE